MAIPHEIQKQMILKRIAGKFGQSRLNELRKIEAELPTFTSGPYVELRKWVKEQMEKTVTKSKIQHKDFFDVEKEGEAQICIVGPPNIGKSSLLKKITSKQIKIGNYAFTTIKPIPAIIKVDGIEIQLVEIPGLIEGATEDKGKQKRLLSIIRNADGIIFMCDATQGADDIVKVKREIRIAGIEKKQIVIANKTDILPNKLDEIKQQFPNVLEISVETGKNLEILKQEIFNLTGLMRVYPYVDQLNAVALKLGSTVENFARKIHKDFVSKFQSARVTGTSAKFPRQQVGISHKLNDNDIVELKLKK
ncbi:GTPase [Nanoarchaeota archaeon]